MDQGSNTINIKIVLLVIAGIWIIWYFGGGPERTETKEGPFIRPLSPLGSGEIYSDHDIAPGQQRRTGTISATQERINITRIFNAGSEDPNEEYVLIRHNGRNAVDATNWTIDGDQINSIELGKITRTPLLGQADQEEANIFYPGDTIAVITGHSPIGTSFRENKCSGYLEQFQDIHPSTSRQCPKPLNEAPENIQNEEDCVDFVEQIPQCEINTQSIPSGVSNQCQAFVTNNIGYNSCVQNNSENDDFFEQGIRVYLNQGQSIWEEESGGIILRNGQNEIIDTFNY